MRTKKYKVDETVLYCAFPDSEFTFIASEREPAFVLSIYEDPREPYYDYRIYIIKTHKIKKVREVNLFPA
jgi:hypothetical protein|tara:strand:- start:8447 stop:8656 length:210 start_codon:yes stop_codon:yes gene_type:complete